MKHHAVRGLTLLELAIAIAVLAVLGALAVPGFNSQLDRQRLRGAAEALLADVNEARFEAARQGRAMHVVMQGGTEWCWAVATEADCACGQGQACELRRALPRDHKGVQLLEATPVQLLANGRAESASSVTFESRICTPSGSTDRYPAC
jgi:type IV fimbrial biogenesis protein FimT